MDFHKELVSLFPVRRSSSQKEAFRSWAVKTAAGLGYAARVESDAKCRNNNVVIGDPDKAQVLFTAHYDTPSRSIIPNYGFANPLMFLLEILCIVICVDFVTTGSGLLMDKLPIHPGIRLAISIIIHVIAFGIIAMMFVGPANKHNANDNTSGVATVFSVMAQLPEAVRSRAAFILFDNEEKGLEGSKAYAKAHPGQAADTLVINMDSVGDGEHIIMAVNKKARRLAETDLLEKVMQATPGCDFHMLRKDTLLLSDHMSFARGITAGAFLHHKIIGYYVGRLHTRKDTVCRTENIDYLTRGLTAFVEQLPGKDA